MKLPLLVIHIEQNTIALNDTILLCHHWLNTAKVHVHSTYKECNQ